MALTLLYFQSWAISVIQLVLCLISYSTLAAFFTGPAKPRSHKQSFLPFLSRIFTLVLTISTIRLLEAGRSHLFSDTRGQAHESSSSSSSFSGREPVAGCFNFTSQALDHYQVLNVSRDVPQARIRPAYTSLARVCHPDKLRGTVVSPEAADINYRRLRLAYEGLRDERARCLYDCDQLFPVSGRGPAARELDRMRCMVCSGGTLWDLVAEMMQEDFQGGDGGGFGAAGKTTKQQQQQQQQQKKKPRADQDYSWDFVAAYTRPGAIGSVVRAAVEETGLVLHRIAVYAVSKAHGWVDVVHGSPLGRLVRYVMGMGMEELILPIWAKLAKL